MLAFACASVPAAAAVGGDSAHLPRPAVRPGSVFAPGEAIVRFERGTSRSERRQARREAGASFEDSLGLPRAELVEVDGPVRAAVRRLERQPGVAYAQPNYRYEATAVETNDTFDDELWGLDDPETPDPGVGALGAWDQGTRGTGQVIAVLDTGVDLTHPDIAPNLWEGSSGEHGFDFVDEDPDPDDYNFHGTHVAATAGAVAGNELGIAGVAPEAEIMAVRVLDGDGFGSTDEIAAGILYAAANGADVINMSLGGLGGDPGDKTMSDAIEVAAAANVVVVAAAGNEAADNDTEPHTPCALPNANLICVAALNRAGALASFSNWGESTVDLAAPGTQILSAKAHYGAPLLDAGFEAGLADWTTQIFNGGLEWGESSSAAVGAKSATDSPGSDYAPALDPEVEAFSYSELLTTAAVNLGVERGCRIHFRTKYEIEEIFDAFFVGALTETSSFDGFGLDGASPGYPSSFTREEVSISDFDGRTDVHPVFAVVADETIEFDGAYVDDVHLICREDENYLDKIANSGNFDQPGSGNYISFQGSSMATPHVAGVVALVRAAAPGLTVQEVIDAVLEGVSAMPNPDPKRRTATFGIADACKATALATEGNVAADCPASSEPSPPEEEGGEEEEGGGEEEGDVTAPPAASSDASNTQTSSGADRTRPRTFFRERPRRVVRTRWRWGKAVFRFGSNERGVRFFCRIDRGPWRRCPARFVRWFRPGKHVLRVRARDAVGNVDRTPAVSRFVVKRRR